MMTIKEFALLCDCKTQTLRYYDKIGLLKPAKVDQWSSYRYYEKSQAIDFVKIKNLQAADFTIEQIKVLLTLPDQQVYSAFDRKIEAQSQKLQRIKEIKQSYLTEKNNMEKLVQTVADYLIHAVSDYKILHEFGLSLEEWQDRVAKLRCYFENRIGAHLPPETNLQMTVNDQIIHGAENIVSAFEALKEGGYHDTVLLGDAAADKNTAPSAENSEVVWECNGWQHVYEFIDNIPAMKPGRSYCFSFELYEDQYTDGLEFPLFMIAAMLLKNDSNSIDMGCRVESSTDGQNHFALLRG